VHEKHKPASLLRDFQRLLKDPIPGPVLDLASGEGKNALFFARKGFKVLCVDRSQDALRVARETAREQGTEIETLRVDLEEEGVDLPHDAYGAILVFRYLHRPLFPWIRKAIAPQGLLFYETFTLDQQRFGKPHRPAFLLRKGELLTCFEDWRLIHYFEGVKQDPLRATAQLICRKPPD
jgi:tellurite methyltransferase